MECCDNDDHQKLLRPKRLTGTAGFDVCKGVELSNLMNSLWNVRNSMRIRNLGAHQKNVVMRKRGRIGIRRAVGFRGRGGRRLGYSHSRFRSAMVGHNNHHDYQSLSVYKRLKKLQRLIPGGRNMEVDVLFQETAQYILSLKMQVHLLQSLSNFLSSNVAVHPPTLGNSDHISS